MDRALHSDPQWAKADSEGCAHGRVRASPSRIECRICTLRGAVCTHAFPNSHALHETVRTPAPCGFVDVSSV
eukprot:360770-Chlamydomonas_euryale.AAC.4